MSNRLRRIPTAGQMVLLLPVAALLLLPLSAMAGPWKGQEVEVDGALHVKNPAEAIDPPMTIELEEVFRLGGWDGGDDEFFGVIADIAEDEDGNLYVLDAQLNEIKVYDADGVYQTSIGREGEGPGEWRNANSLFWMPNGDLGVIQVFPGRIVTLKKDGTPGEDFQLEALEGDGFRVLMGAERSGDNLAITYAMNNFDQEAMTFTQQNVLAYFDAEGKEIAQLYTADSKMDFANPTISEVEFDTYRNRWTADVAGRTFAVPSLDKYEILVWNPDGELARVIEREYAPHPRTDEEKEELLEIYKGFTRGQQLPPNTTYDIEDNHPCIQWRGLHTRPDGSLWVETSRGSNNEDEGSLGTFDIYDPKGRFVRQATLKGQCDNGEDGIFFVGDRIFVVTQFLSSAMAAQGGGRETEEDGEEPEPMALICYRSDQLDVAAGIPSDAGESR